MISDDLVARLKEAEHQNDVFMDDLQEAAEVIETLRARVAELEAQLEAIGAGGVNGPLEKS